MESDAIVVLGGGIDAEGNLRGPSQCRIKKAVQLFKKGMAKHIIVSSKWSMILNYEPKATIAEAMQKALIEQEIPKDNIYLENLSKDTIGNAYFTLTEILKPKNWENIIVVTSHFHKERAEYLFKKILGPKYHIRFEIADDGLSGEDLEKHRSLEKELLKKHKKAFGDILDGDIESFKKWMDEFHPAYLKNPKAIKIIQISDTHLFKNDDNELLSVKSNARFLETIDRVREEAPDYLFITGDVSQDETTESYQKLAASIDQLKINSYWIPGNHDDIETMRAAFREADYLHEVEQLTLSEWNFIFLNSKLDNSASGLLSPDELNKLRRLLHQSKTTKTAIVIHHHPVPVGTPLIDQYILENKQAFWDIVDKHQNVTLILCGHVHGDYTIKHNNVTIECSPATCFQWKKGTKALVNEKSTGYKKHLVTKDSISSEAVIWNFHD